MADRCCSKEAAIVELMIVASSSEWARANTGANSFRLAIASSPVETKSVLPNPSRIVEVTTQGRL
jgi:hypothetical protein